jgi:Protein of unknown function (DUF3738)
MQGRDHEEEATPIHCVSRAALWLRACLVPACMLFSCFEPLSAAEPTKIFSVQEVIIKAPRSAQAEEDFVVEGQRLKLRNVTIKWLIAESYDLSPRLVVGGPPSLGSRRFDIDIVSNFHPSCSSATRLVAYRPLIQEVLETRFNLILRELSRGRPLVKPCR